MNRPMHHFTWLCLVLIALGGCRTREQRATRAWMRGEYYEAERLYNQLYRSTAHARSEHRARYAWYAGASAWCLRDWDRALRHFTSAHRYGYSDSTLSLRLGQTYQMKGMYDEAERHYRASLRIDSALWRAKVGLSGIELARSYGATDPKYSIQPWSTPLSAMSEYAARYGSGGSVLYYVSRKRMLPTDKRSKRTGETPARLYKIGQSIERIWQMRADTLPTLGVNRGLEDGVVLTSDGQTIIYTYHDTDKVGQVRRSLYTARRLGALGWSQGKPLSLGDGAPDEAMCPQLSADGKVLYFSGRRSSGDWDIYMIAYNHGQTSGLAIHLGQEINTLGDELYPEPVGDSLLYFASDGHAGLGGYDIYRARIVDGGAWQVEHLPPPINSPVDELSLVPQNDTSEERGILISSRGDARGRPHLYKYRAIVDTTIITGVVHDRDEKPIVGALVQALGRRHGAKMLATTTSADGSYALHVHRNTEYALRASAKDYLGQWAKLTTEGDARQVVYDIVFRLSSRVRPERIEAIHFAFDSAELLPESEPVIRELYQILTDNPEIRMLLIAHTDRHGTQRYNQRLSEERAQNLRQALISRGIVANRLVSIGKGSSEPPIVDGRMAQKYPFLTSGELLTPQRIQELAPDEQSICDALVRRCTYSVLER